MRATKKKYGTEYWEYALLYTDDVLVVSERCKQFLRFELEKYFELKEESIGPPKIYLGGKMPKVVLENGLTAWSFTSSQYVQTSVNTVKESRAQQDAKFPARANTPLSSNYRPEIDVSREPQPAEAAYYQCLIGIHRWMFELGRVDIFCEVSMMSSHLSLPREGHLKELFHIFAYIRKYHNYEMVFDHSDLVVYKRKFDEKYWTASEFGSYTEEELPANMSMPRGFGVVMKADVDADHARDSITRRS